MKKFNQIDFKELKNFLLERISVVDVHERYSGFVNRVGSMSVCPFCGEDKFYETNYNKFKCYNSLCSNGGGLYDIYAYYMEKFSVDFFTALISLAKDFNYIDMDVADKILNKTYKGVSVKLNKTVVQNSEKIKKIEGSKIQLQSLDVINNVYEALSVLSPLKDSEFKYLSDIRGLSFDRIAADYFTMPNMYKENGAVFMKRFISYISTKYGYTEDTLIGVPGFYRDENNNVAFVPRKGIAMKSRNASGLVNGIQIRNYDCIKQDGTLFLGQTKEGKSKAKYIWVSSRGLKDGCGCAAAVDSIIPKIPKAEMNGNLYITEGKFKSEIISKVSNSPVIALPGVKQWRRVLDSEIRFINENVNNINTIYVCFDADLGTNLDVYYQLKSMTEEILLKYNIKIKMIVWSEVFGKGLDDVILSNNKSKCKAIAYEKYMDEYDSFLKELEDKYSIINGTVCYKRDENEDTELEKVDKDELNQLYSQLVLLPLNISID